MVANKLQKGRPQQGFTLIEVMIVITIIIIIAAFAMPRYKRYVVETKRADTMVELQNIAKQIESKKTAMGGYDKIERKALPKKFPVSGNQLYKIDIQAKVAPATTYSNLSDTDTLTSQWKVVAAPVAGQMKGDGDLSLNYQGVKCRIVSTTDKRCGKGDQWRK